jgi:pimeloyl-ACP methyl ester carboxylesterase
VVSDCRLIGSTDGVRIAVHDFGGPEDPAAPVVLFSHATGFHGQVFALTATLLTDRYRCLAFDLRGHGVSETPPGTSFAWEHFAEDVLAVLHSDLVGRGREVHGVGHSMGGASLLLAAAREPGWLRSLWVYEPAVRRPREDVPEDQSDLMIAIASRRRSTFASHEEAFANYASKPPLNVLYPEVLMAYVKGGFAHEADGQVTLRCLPSTEAAVFGGFNTSGVWNALSSIDLPVAVVAGRPDPTGANSSVGPIVAQLPQGTQLECPGLGHFGPLQDPVGIAGNIADWVGAHR